MITEERIFSNRLWLVSLGTECLVWTGVFWRDILILFVVVSTGHWWTYGLASWHYWATEFSSLDSSQVPRSMKGAQVLVECILGNFLGVCIEALPDDSVDPWKYRQMYPNDKASVLAPVSTFREKGLTGGYSILTPSTQTLASLPAFLLDPTPAASKWDVSIIYRLPRLPPFGLL